MTADGFARTSIMIHERREPFRATTGPVLRSVPAGMESPRGVGDTVPLVERAFAFVDLCGFTRFIAEQGEHSAIAELDRFRLLTRQVAARRGVRIAKWLGDGVMLVGVEVGPTIACGAELMARWPDDTLAVRGGVAHGSVLLYDGDDYIGRPANLAARLCDAAEPGELLGRGYDDASLPAWTRVVGTRTVALRGIGVVADVQVLALRSGVDLP